MQLVKLALGIVIPLAAFTLGASVRVGDGRGLWRDWRLLARSLFAILIVVPLFADLATTLLGVPVEVRAGLMIAVVAIGIGPITGLRHTEKGTADQSYAVGLDVTLLVLSVGYLPLMTLIHGVLHQQSIRVHPGEVAVVVFTRQLLPIAAGILIGRKAPRIAPIAARIVHIALLVVVAIVALPLVRLVAHVPPSAWWTAALVAVGALTVGHVLGGPARETRVVLASFSVFRFPALALLIASRLPHRERLVPVVLVYVLVGSVAVALYGLAMRGWVSQRRPAEAS